MPIITYVTDHNQARYYDPERWGGAAPEPDRVEAIAVDHRRGCPNGNPGWPDTSRTSLDNECLRRGCRIGYHLFSHTGAVLKTRERNMRDDSDFFATYWDSEKGETGEVEYASTRGWSYFNHAVIDATDEVLAAYAEWQRKRAIEREERRQAKLREQQAIRATMPQFGETWIVASNRSKIPYGTIVEIAGDPELSKYASPLAGHVFWKESLEERYERAPSNVTVRVRLADGTQRWISCSAIRREEEQEVA